ncbi:MAG: hypothetical protein JNK33_04860 [Candidatus Doudnabacteria bacterium]|nr:hypothetical protein [Candidatus Doudnabacteria bacterium]
MDADQVSQEIQRDLGVGKPAVTPIVQESRFKVVDTASENDISDYATKAVEKINTYYESMATDWPAILTATPDPVLAQGAATGAKKLVDSLYSLPVPKPAVGLHRAIVAGAVVHQDMVVNTNNVARGIQPRGAQWRVIPTFLASRAELDNLDREIQKLTLAYGDIQLGNVATASSDFFNVAQAGIPVSVVADIPRILEQFLRSLLGTLVLNFIKDRITSLVENLEKNFTVANFLYYTDAVINTKYGNDYLKKYVPKTQDQEMIKKFLPQFNCGKQNADELKRNLRAKAVEYLGFDPSIPLDTTSPKFWTDLSRTADLQGDEPGYQRLYKALAVVAEGQAKEASVLEQTSTTGKKSPLDEQLSKGITKSVDYISKKIEAALNSVFNIAPTNATTGGPGFSAFVVNIVLGIINQLVIKGATIKEQAACVAVPVLNPIIPGDFTPNNNAVSNSQVVGCMQDVAACRALIFNQQTNNNTTTCQPGDTNPLCVGLQP